METEKEIYCRLCKEDTSIPLYSRSWWLDCVCGKKMWDVVLYTIDTVIVAALPYYKPCSRIITMPPFTQTMGIWFNPQFQFDKEQFQKQFISEKLIKKLPDYNFFLQGFDNSYTDWLPFYWNNFKQTTFYTYIYSDISNNILSGNVLRNINKAKNRCGITIKRGVSIENFLKIHNKTYKRQGIKSYNPALLEKIIKTARLRGQGDIWGAYDNKENIHAAVFIVWQKSCAYYIAGGSDPKLRKYGGHIYALWQSIQDVTKDSKSFDFSGSMVRGIESIFRDFGAEQKPYFIIKSGSLNLLKKICIYIKKRW
jgi:lipid II:glycine glycyltransferase (peptidoglycan interpeptide bridge formation enzyme)